MQLTKANLKKLIQEEIENVLLKENPSMLRQAYKNAISDCEGGKDGLEFLAARKHNIVAKRYYNQACAKRSAMGCPCQ
jgi:hypothetical protein